MFRKARPILVLPLILLSGLAASPALAQEETASGPRLESLVELAETLGEAHAIRALCNGDSDQTWRNYMQNLMDMEAPGGGQRRAALTSGFNRGYRTQSSQHKGCTPDLRQVEAQIAAHGHVIADAIAKSYLK
ncbi:MAG: TIGR02301 family protein [Alphaproteobacteria bacterium]